MLIKHVQKRFHPLLSIHIETISSHTESMPKNFLRMLAAKLNFGSFYMDIQRQVVPMRNDFIPCWAYMKTVSSFAEHFPETNYAGSAQSSYCIQPASMSYELGIYELLTVSIHSFLARSHYIWATSYLQIAFLSSKPAMSGTTLFRHFSSSPVISELLTM
jgi:hypothetical protein